MLPAGCYLAEVLGSTLRVIGQKQSPAVSLKLLMTKNVRTGEIVNGHCYHDMFLTDNAIEATLKNLGDVLGFYENNLLCSQDFHT